MSGPEVYLVAGLTACLLAVWVVDNVSARKRKTLLEGLYRIILAGQHAQTQPVNEGVPVTTVEPRKPWYGRLWGAMVGWVWAAVAMAGLLSVLALPWLFPNQFGVSPSTAGGQQLTDLDATAHARILSVVDTDQIVGHPTTNSGAVVTSVCENHEILRRGEGWLRRTSITILGEFTDKGGGAPTPRSGINIEIGPLLSNVDSVTPKVGDAQTDEPYAAAADSVEGKPGTWFMMDRSEPVGSSGACVMKLRIWPLTRGGKFSVWVDFEALKDPLMRDWFAVYLSPFDFGQSSVEKIEGSVKVPDGYSYVNMHFSSWDSVATIDGRRVLRSAGWTSRPSPEGGFKVWERRERIRFEDNDCRNPVAFLFRVAQN
jgi:hypothetical protein